MLSKSSCVQPISVFLFRDQAWKSESGGGWGHKGMQLLYSQVRILGKKQDQKQQAQCLFLGVGAFGKY